MSGTDEHSEFGKLLCIEEEHEDGKDQGQLGRSEIDHGFLALGSPCFGEELVVHSAPRLKR